MAPTFSWNFLPLPAGLRDVRNSAREFTRWWHVHGWHPLADDNDKLRVVCAAAIHKLHKPFTVRTADPEIGHAPSGQWGEGSIDIGEQSLVFNLVDALYDACLPPRVQVWPGTNTPEMNGTMDLPHRPNPVLHAGSEAEDDWFTMRDAWRAVLNWGDEWEGFLGYCRPDIDPQFYVKCWLTLNRGWQMDSVRWSKWIHILNWPTRYTNIVPSNLNDASTAVVTSATAVGIPSPAIAPTWNSITELVSDWWGGYFANPTGRYGNLSFPIGINRNVAGYVSSNGYYLNAVPKSWHGRKDRDVPRIAKYYPNSGTIRRSKNLDTIGRQ